MAQDLSSQLSQQARDLAAQDQILADLIAQRNQQDGQIVATNQEGPLLAQIAARYRELGIELPTDYAFNFDPNVPGGVEVTRSNYFTRNADWILPAAVGGGVGLAALAGSGAAAAAAPASSAAGGGATAGSTAALGPVAAGGGTTAFSGTVPAALSTGVGGGAMAGALGSIWDHLPTIIGAGTALVGTKMQSDAVKDASQTQAEAADKALALQREMLALERQDSERAYEDLAPYRNLGGYAVGGLGHLVGMPENYGTDPILAKTKQATTPQQTPVQAAAEKIKPLLGSFAGQSPMTPSAESQGLSALGPAAAQMTAQAMSGSSYVDMEAPTGERGRVPAHRVVEAEASGARRISHGLV